MVILRLAAEGVLQDTVHLDGANTLSDVLLDVLWEVWGTPTLTLFPDSDEAFPSSHTTGCGRDPPGQVRE